ncbi:MAG: HlyC/CorC family transporter [Chloroflexia bacterium]|nr:HlyC/CorC family transporter [Chloroflexia bacterium]
MEDPISTALGLIAVVVLVLANGFFVATEFSLVSVRRTRIQQLAAEGNRRAATLLDRITHLDTYIAATQLGITISSLALGWIGKPVVAVVLENILHYLPIEIGSTTLHAISFVLAFSLVTALHIVIGELAPKSLALQRPEQTALAVSSAIHVFLVIFRPIIVALNWVGNRVVKLFGIDPAGGHAMVQSAAELMISIEASREAGFVNQTAHDLVGRAFSFNDMQARHVMVPRTEVTALPLDSTVDDVMTLAAESSFTRLPVFEGDSDHIVGIIKMKRLFPVFMARSDANAVARTNGNGDGNGALAGGRVTVTDHRTGAVNGTAHSNGNEIGAHGSSAATTDFDIRDYMMEPMLVPETLAASEVLTRMRENHVQMAVVIDEYGGTAGIVTLQDIVTHLIGRIQEQGEQTEPDGPGPDGLIHLDGLTGLVELRERYDIDLLSEGYDVETLGGYVFSLLGRPAIVGDEVRAPSGQTFVVEEMDGLRVARIQVVPEHYNGPIDATVDDRQPVHAA